MSSLATAGLAAGLDMPGNRPDARPPPDSMPPLDHDQSLFGGSPPQGVVSPDVMARGTEPPPAEASDSFDVDNVVAPGGGYDAPRPASDLPPVGMPDDPPAVPSVDFGPADALPETAPPRTLPKGPKVDRPVVVARLTEPAVEAIVRKHALGMPSSFKVERIGGVKALLVRGLLASQAKLLQERLAKEGVVVELVAQGALQLGFNPSDLGDMLPSPKKAAIAVASVVVAVGVVVAVMTVADGMRDPPQSTTVATTPSPTTSVAPPTRDGAPQPATVKTPQRPPAPRVVVEVPPPPGTYSPRHVGFGGQSATWWRTQIRKLRIRERTVPASERARVRALLEDTERKARRLGIAGD